MQYQHKVGLVVMKVTWNEKMWFGCNTFIKKKLNKIKKYHQYSGMKGTLISNQSLR